jgi:hypothetical protein
MSRTRLSICNRKARYLSADAAREAAAKAPFALHAYRCDRGGHFHLTSRTKGKRIAQQYITANPAIALCAKAE